jgi:very-short-patch-repair endonuclease
MSWVEVARQQEGLISRAQLHSAGLSPHRIDAMVRARALEPCTRGVLLVRGAPLTYLARIWAAILATGGVTGFGTAAELWGVEVGQSPRIDVIIDPARRVAAPPGVRLHRVYTPAKVVTRRDQIPITNRGWTVLDHLGRLPRGDAYRLADRAFQRSWVERADIERRLRDYPGRQGNATLRRIADRCGDGAAAESERVLHRLLRQAHISGWVANHPLWVAGELVGVLDVALVEQRIAIEIDGWAFHSDVDRFQRDRRRQNALIGLGWTVLRFTWADLVERPGYVIATIRRQLALAC